MHPNLHIKDRIMGKTRYKGLSSIYATIMTCNPFLQGLKSLGSLGGDNSLFNEYLSGNNMSDLKRDWETIASDMNKILKGNTIYAR